MVEDNVIKRDMRLDIARTVAIVCVVLCHCVELVYALNSQINYNTQIFLNYDVLNSVSEKSGFFMISIFTIGRLGVPIFLFLTGALVLKKSFNEGKDIINFYKKNLIPLIVSYFIWIIIYNICFFVKRDFQNLNVLDIIKELLLLKQGPLSNMWYMPMIILMYFGLPFIAKIVKEFSFKTLSIIFILLFGICFIVPMINIITNFFELGNFNSSYNIYFFGGLYGVYIIIGYYLYNSKLKNHSNKYYFFIGIISLIFTVIVQFFTYKYGVNRYVYFVWYDFPFLLISAICLFKIIVNKNCNTIQTRFVKCYTFISKSSLSIFYVHALLLYFFRSVIVNISINLPLKVLLLFCVTFALSILISFILSRVKLISKYVILFKN